MSNWEEFYSSAPKPATYDEDVLKIENFVELHSKNNKKIALVTSGGTTVPLEHNTVRFVDNFSAGSRGSASAECFLRYGYAVVFLYRLKSLEPFVRHFAGRYLFDSLEVKGNNGIEVRQERVPELMPILEEYEKAKKSNNLLSISFTTLADYLWMLRACSDSLAKCSSRALFYLAAAVSDFYIPNEHLSVHKIQSQVGPLNISLQLVPKVLKPLVSSWVPNAFIVSFKLETDERILLTKAREALCNYNHHLVIGNTLNSKKYKVIFVTKSNTYDIVLSSEESEKGIEIESKIVKDLSNRHDQFLSLPVHNI